MPNINIENNVSLTKEAFEEAVLRGLDACGMTAETYAKLACPVKTGRLRNSITYSVGDKYGTHNYTDNQGNSYSQQVGQAEKNAVYIGSNVEYAEAVEFRDNVRHVVGAAHFLKNAVATHVDRYQQLIKESLENA